MSQPSGVRRATAAAHPCAVAFPEQLSFLFVVFLLPAPPPPLVLQVVCGGLESGHGNMQICPKYCKDSQSLKG